MKRDASKDTFHPEKHYARVFLQQGRVQLDADWNEQGDIVAGRIETETTDVIGPCGAPDANDGFGIFAISAKTTGPDNTERGRGNFFGQVGAGDFGISAGRLYVDGILCVNEAPTTYLQQKDFPSPPKIVNDGLYLVYLDVWLRHITALDDPSIREVALGGPDTATRAKVLWQVKVLPLDASVKATCATDVAAYKTAIASPTGKLTARTKPEQTSANPCIVPPGAGYSGLENQFYRVEIHDSGSAFDSGTSATLFTVARVPNTNNQVTFSGGTWSAGQAVELISSSSTNPLNGTLVHVTNVDSPSKTLTFDADISASDFTDVRLRPVDTTAATYKWSRDNGSVVAKIENIKGAEVTVHDLGPDDVLGFAVGQWVEVIDDVAELNGRPGLLAQIIKADRAINLITLSTAPPPLATKNNQPDLSANPKLRRWDGIEVVKFEKTPVADDDLKLENGILIRFSDGTYRTGDYWTFPARTATADAQSGNIEWPADANGTPLPQPPRGIDHHYCRLGMLRWNKANAAFDSVEDCRHLFPPLTSLTRFVYVGGDGQEAKKGEDLQQPLIAGVFNGSLPVAGARVHFVAEGKGVLAPTAAALPASTASTLDVVTGADGLVKCFWRLDPDVKNPSQIVTAQWLDADGKSLFEIPFNANLSIADQVWYDAGDCAAFKSQNTVQSAVSRLTTLVSLYAVSGNDQLILPGVALQPLTVLAANRCGPVANQVVQFKAVGNSGSVPAQATTGPLGTASVTWTPDPNTLHQEVEASISGDGVTPPTTVRFTANIAQQRDAGIHILKITSIADTQQIDNDTSFFISRLFQGIAITCDGNIDSTSFGPSPEGHFVETTPEKPTCYLTVDIPYPLKAEQGDWDFPQIFGFMPIKLASKVTVNGATIQWVPQPTALRWLTIALSRLGNFTDRLQARLTLKGNYIWSTDTPPLFLDGEAFGIPTAAKRTGLTLSGNDRKGGDFEMWFWLQPAPPPPTLNIAIDPGGLANKTVRGRVSDGTGAVLPGVTVTLTAVVITARFGPLTTTTDTSGSFTFPPVASGNYTVEAKAADGRAVQTNVTVP